MPKPHAITTNVELSGVIDALQHVSEIAIDTEADSLYAYHARVCLVQVGIPGHDWVIDPLAPDIDLSPLWQLIRTKKLLLHGCDYDLRMLDACHNVHVSEVYDTMLGARYLNESHIGLAALVHKNFGVELDKSSQKANWAMRPIPDKMLEYAAQDTHFLFEIARRQRAELEAQGKLAWVNEHCEMVRQQAYQLSTDAHDPWRIKGLSGLSRRQLAQVKAIWEWRDAIASRRNVPPFKIFSNEKIIDLADRLGNKSSVLLSDLWGMPRNVVGTILDDLLERTHQAAQLSEDECPSLPTRAVPPPAPNAQLMEKLKIQRDKLAAKWNIDPTLMSNKHQMVLLAFAIERKEESPWANAELMLWQQELWQSALQR
jgi:ribonuclease D